MKDEGTYYHEQVIILRSEEVLENQVEERKEEQTEDPQEPHREKEESIETSPTSAPTPEVPRVQEKSLAIK